MLFLLFSLTYLKYFQDPKDEDLRSQLALAYQWVLSSIHGRIVLAIGHALGAVHHILMVEANEYGTSACDFLLANRELVWHLLLYLGKKEVYAKTPNENGECLLS